MRVSADLLSELYSLTGKSIVLRTESGPMRTALFSPDVTLGEVLQWAWRTNRRELPGPVVIELDAAKEEKRKD